MKPAMISAAHHLRPGLDTVLRRIRYDGQLLLERRLWLFLLGDAFFLFAGLLEAIESMNQTSVWLNKLYPQVVVMPMHPGWPSLRQNQ